MPVAPAGWGEPIDGAALPARSGIEVAANGDTSPVPSGNPDEPALRARIEAILGADSPFLKSRTERAVRLGIRPAALARIFSLGRLDDLLNSEANRQRVSNAPRQAPAIPVKAPLDPSAVPEDPEARVHRHLAEALYIGEATAHDREFHRRIGTLFSALPRLRLRPDQVAIRLLGVRSASALDEILANGSFGLTF